MLWHIRTHGITFESFLLKLCGVTFETCVACVLKSFMKGQTRWFVELELKIYVRGIISWGGVYIFTPVFQWEIAYNFKNALDALNWRAVTVNMGCKMTF